MAAVELPLHLRVLHRCVDGSWAIVLVCEGGAVVFFVVATTSGWVPMIWGWALLGVVSLVTMPLLCFETWEDDREERSSTRTVARGRLTGSAGAG